MKERSILKEIEEIGKKAVKEARKENTEKGLPNVDSVNGKICYHLATGKTVNAYAWNN